MNLQPYTYTLAISHNYRVKTLLTMIMKVVKVKYLKHEIGTHTLSLARRSSSSIIFNYIIDRGREYVALLCLNLSIDTLIH